MRASCREVKARAAATRKPLTKRCKIKVFVARAAGSLVAQRFPSAIDVSACSKFSRNRATMPIILRHLSQDVPARVPPLARNWRNGGTKISVLGPWFRPKPHHWSGGSVIAEPRFTMRFCGEPRGASTAAPRGTYPFVWLRFFAQFRLRQVAAIATWSDDTHPRAYAMLFMRYHSRL